MKTHFPLVYHLIGDMNKAISESGKVISPAVKDLFYELQKSLLLRAANIWLQLGRYAYFLVLEDLTSEFHNLKPKKDTDVKEKVDSILVHYLGTMRIQYGQCINKNMSQKFLKLFEIIKEEVKESDKRILVFAFERRIVKYMQRVFNDFIERLPTEEKAKFMSSSVCGVSASRNQVNENHQGKSYANPSDFEKMRTDARTKHLEYESEMKNRGGNINESMNSAIHSEQQKYDNSKLTKLMLEP
jgi:hypothetical protein